MHLPLRAFRLSLKPISLCAFSAKLPDHTLGSERAIGAGVGARLAVFQTLPAIADPHLLTGDVSFPIRMISTSHDWTSKSCSPIFLCFCVKIRAILIPPS